MQQPLPPAPQGAPVQWQMQQAQLASLPLYVPLPPPSIQPSLEQNIVVVERFQGQSTCVEIQEYRHLGITEIWPGNVLPAGARTLRRVHVHMQTPQASFRCEAGALHYCFGRITLHSEAGGPGNLLKNAIKSSLTHEATIKPRYEGCGHWYSEPSPNAHYAIVFIDTLTDGCDAVVDKGLYYCSEDCIEIGVAAQQNVSSALFGGEGMFQTKLKGRGWVVLQVPNPVCEIHKVRLAAGEKLSVDGNYACLRRGRVEFKVEKAAKGLFGSKVSGEGLLQVFEASGPAEVWVCCTQLPPPQPH